MRFSTRITIDGNPVVINVPRGTAAWRKANAIFCPLGPAPTRGWFLMHKSDLDRLNLNTAHTVAWESLSDDGSEDKSLTFPGLYIVSAERLLHGGPSDSNALHLVELADGRLLAERNSETGVLQSNLRSFANQADYLTGTTTYGTWAALLEALWTACGTLGAWPGLPGGLPIDAQPENTWMMGLNAYRSLCAVLEQLDCAINRNPLTGVCTIQQLGATQAIAAGTTSLKWDGEPRSSNITQIAATLKIYHYFHRKAYGQERDTELANNWAVNGMGNITTLATGVDGAAGTSALWDDLPIILDESGAITNETAITTRGNNRKTRYVTRWTVANQHRIHIGLQNTFLPGGQIRATLWRNWDDGDENPFGGTVTEFVCCPQLVAGMTAGGSGGQAWLDPELVTPEHEQYAPPDLGRHSFPNYPRLPNIVQVWHDSATPGATVSPDATVSGGVRLHSGRVKRWVANEMATLDACWILFVDDFDNQAGNIQVRQGEYYGPARLSGVATVGSMLPVYTVRSGTLEIAQALTPFRLTDDIFLGGTAPAVKMALDGGGAYQPTAEAIVVVDAFFNTGCWQAYSGSRGFARQRSDNAYDIVFMERPSLVLEATTINDRTSGTAPPSETVASTITGRYQQGGKLTPDELAGSAVLFDDVPFFPRALRNGQSISLWNDVLQRREMIQCQQQGIYALAQLASDLTDQTEDIRVTDFEIESFSPFNLTPPGAPDNIRAVNFMHLHGEAGDTVTLLWLEAFAKWLIIGVDEDQRVMEMVTLSSDNGSGNIQTGRLSLDLFVGRTITPYIGARVAFDDRAPMARSRPCIIQFADFNLDENQEEPVLAEFERIYGPAKWVGVLGTVDFGFLPVYRCCIGEQEFHGKCDVDVLKGTPGTFEIYDYGDPPAGTGITFQASVTYNNYRAGKFARIHRDMRGITANQVEK